MSATSRNLRFWLYAVIWFIALWWIVSAYRTGRISIGGLLFSLVALGVVTLIFWPKRRKSEL